MNTHELAEERSLALHRIVAERAIGDASILDEAKVRVARWLASGVMAPAYAERWNSILSLPPSEVAERIVANTEDARALRQTTPFTFVVSPRDRWRLWREVRDR